MKRYLLTVVSALLPMLFAASCDKDNAQPDIFGEDDYVFPANRTETVAAGDTVDFAVECPLSFGLSLSNYKYFYMLDEDGQERSSLNFVDGGRAEVEVHVRDIANFDEEIVSELTMTVGSRSQTVLTLTLGQTSREIKISVGVYDYDELRFIENAYEEVAEGEPLTFVFNRSVDAYELPVRIECDFDWGYRNASGLEWLDFDKLVEAQNDTAARRLTIVAGTLDPDGMSGTLTLTAASGSDVADIRDVEFAVPSSRDICYAYMGSSYTGSEASTAAFDAAGVYNNPNAAEAEYSISGAVVGLGAQIAVVAPKADGEGFELADGMIAYGEADAALPELKRGFTFTPGANTGYARTLTLLVFNDTVPADLVTDEGVNEAYADRIFCLVSQTGEKFDTLVNFVDYTLYSQVDFNLDVAREHGLKCELLTDGDTVASTVRSALGVDDLEVWRMTFNTENTTVSTGVGPFPLGMFASFYLAGYESQVINYEQNDDLHAQLGIDSLLTLSTPENDQSTPTSYYIDFTAEPKNGQQFLLIAYTTEEVVDPDTKVRTYESREPVAAIHIICDTSATF